MRKKAIALLLALLLSVTGLPVHAQEAPGKTVEISTAGQLVQLAQDCRLDSYSAGLTVVLQNDIDLTGLAFESIPIFCGTFDGAGHTVSGLVLTGAGSEQGLFRTLTADALVKDLTVQGSVQPTGSRSTVGGIAGSNAGSILGCGFSGQVAGADLVGGLVGENRVTGIIENCTVDGSVQGSHFVGGIAGKNNGVVRDCTNRAAVNVTEQQNSVSLSELTVENLTGSEFAAAATDIGGIAGTGSGVVRSCANTGAVGYPHMGYNIGGIAGSFTGYIVDCTNSGLIQGRKEVGGIVGQLEPAALLEYDADALQILSGQMQQMNGLVNRTAADLKEAESSINTQVGSIAAHVDNAQASLELLLPDREDPSLPDADTVQAARSGIANSMTGIDSALRGIGSTAGSALGALSQNLTALQQLMNAMAGTLNGAGSTLGGSITDVSDADTPDDLTAKVERCTNNGSVQADRNAGGIAGAMAMENDFDPEDDWTLQGELSLNFESELRCVVLSCHNTGALTVKKSGAGGVVGQQAMGLVKGCGNTGPVQAAAAEYVGGIVGRSAGYLRACSAKCTLAGQRYVGGIAGTAALLTDSRSAVRITGGEENIGALVGAVQPYAHRDQQTPFSGNYYLAVDADRGGIDGVSYAGQAQPLDRAAFLALPELDAMFQNAAVTFLFEDGTAQTVTLPMGGALRSWQVPALPAKAGYEACWAGLDGAEVDGVWFDMTFTAQYTAHGTVLQSDLAGENGLPLLLVQGDFLPGAALTAAPCDGQPSTGEQEQLLGSWQFAAADAQALHAVRLQQPAAPRQGTLTVYLYRDGSWAAVPHTVDGSYLVAELAGGETAIALTHTPTDLRPHYMAAAALALVLVMAAAVTALVLRRKKKKTKV